MTQEQNQSPCDHPEPCACFAEGNYVGRESAHRQLREWLPDDHERDCMCEPCRTAIAVLQAFQPGIIDYRDLATLYAERGGRQSDQTPYGDFNYDDRPAPERTAGMLRVSYIHDTGDWYATHPVDGGRALLIGNITPLAPWEHIAVFLEDWDQHGVPGRPLSWYQRMIALFNAGHVPAVLATIRKR